MVCDPLLLTVFHTYSSTRGGPRIVFYKCCQDMTGFVVARKSGVLQPCGICLRSSVSSKVVQRPTAPEMDASLIMDGFKRLLQLTLNTIIKVEVSNSWRAAPSVEKLPQQRTGRHETRKGPWSRYTPHCKHVTTHVPTTSAICCPNVTPCADYCVTLGVHVFSLCIFVIVL